MRINTIYPAILSGLLFFACSSDTDLMSEQPNVPTLKGGTGKVEICHFDGYTGEYETLSVSVKSAEKHLAHGDYLGACATSVIYNFDSCSLEDLVQVTGTSYITQNGLSGCGVELNQSSLRTPIKYGYGTYEMDAKPLNAVSNQYLYIGLNAEGTEAAFNADIRAAGTDDPGLGFYVNGTLVLHIVGSAQMPVSYPNWYHVKVEVAPDYVRLWLDDTLMYEEYDYGGITEPNYWGIASYSQSAFDNLAYTPF